MGHPVLQKMADKIRFIKKGFCGVSPDKSLLKDGLSPKNNAFKKEVKERRQKDFQDNKTFKAYFSKFQKSTNSTCENVEAPKWTAADGITEENGFSFWLITLFGIHH